jgi:serine/threonine protein kinase
MTAPDPSPGPAASRVADAEVERLLESIVDLPEAEQGAAVGDLCAAWPELAAALRERFAHYRRLLRALPEPLPPRTNTRFGEFELLRELGRGGMGVVYLARQQRAGQDRLVALKLVRDRGLLSPQARERLRREAAASFRLDDPGLCPVFDTGETDGVPWLAMRYVPGRTLAEHIGEARPRGALGLPTTAITRTIDTEPTAPADTSAGHQRHAAVLAVGEALARSLHVAHEAGFVHRDVKPGNVMITPDGQPVLLDFGLVRDDGSDHSLTATGEALGTPAYMAPEQIDGRSPIDRTVDVYALAATLWEAIALERPFAGRTREELFAAILQHDLGDLRRLAPGVPRDLQIVLATAMAREPARRYATALEFALELGRVRRNEPILTTPPGPLRRLAMWSQRNRLAALLLAGLLVSLLSVLWVNGEARAAEHTARLAERRAIGNLTTAREAIAELIYVQNNELEDVPGLEGLRRDMQERALALLRGFRTAGGVGDDPGLTRDNARALMLGATLELSLGRPDAAGRLHAEARELLDTLPPDPHTHVVQGHWHLLRGELLARRGDIDAAIDAQRAAVEGLTSAEARDADRVRAMRALFQLSKMLDDRNDRAAALDHVDRAIALRQRSRAPDNPRVVAAWSEALLHRANLHREANRTEAAGADLRQAEAVLRASLATAGENRRVTARLADCLFSQARLDRVLGDAGSRQQALREAQELLERLVVSFPQMPSYRHSLADVLLSRASGLAAEGDAGQATAVLLRAREYLQELVDRYPEADHYRLSLAGVLFNLGNRSRDEPEASQRLYVETLAQLDQLLARRPDQARWHELAARAALNLAIVRARDGQASAGDTFARSRQYTDHVLRLRPTDRRSRELRALLLFNEGTFRAEAGELAPARALLEQAFEQARLCLAATPGNAARAADVLKWGVRAAQVTELAAPDEAEAMWRLVDAAWCELPPAMRTGLEQDPAAALDRCMLRRRLAAMHARPGADEVPRELAHIVASLATIATADGYSPALRSELLLCLADLAAAATTRGEAPVAARHEAAAVAHLRAWPAADVPDHVTRARLRLRLPQLDAIVGSDHTARAALLRVAGPD